jgi:hypothetical protein
VGVPVRGLPEAILLAELGTKLHCIVTITGSPREQQLKAPHESVEALTAIIEPVRESLIEKTGGRVVRKIEDVSKSLEDTVVEVFKHAADVNEVESRSRAELERGRKGPAGV